MSSFASFSIRKLGQDDVAPMEGLLEVFADAFEEPQTYKSAPPSKAYLQRLLGAEHFITVVALKEGAVVGGLTAYELQKYEQERSEIYIYDLAVAEAYRREGIATALIQDVREIAASRSAHVIFVQADIGDEPPIALYTKLGRREDVHHFDIEVP